MMECIEARALKPSFLSQMATTMTMSPHHHHHHHHHHVFYNDDDDVLCFTGINGAEDNFPVEDLLNLDFPEEVKEGCINLQEHQEEEEEEDSQKRDYSSNNSSSPTFSEFDSLPAGELAVPVDDLENLEWLSQFVDDSTADLSLLYPTGSFSDKNCANPSNRFEPAKKPVKKVRAPCFPLPAPGKARTKRSKPNKRQWSMASLPSSAAENSSSTTSSSYGSSTLPPPALMRSVHDTDWFITSAEKPVVKKQKRKPEGVENGVISGRKCSHCQVQKTPQWRTGPLGPKTLCNACGVRFKSGRLYPEYRPACSPTFLQEMHSNSHRKVLEMRRKKETTAGVAELDLASEVLIEPVVGRPVQTELQSSRCVYEPVADGIVQF